MNDATSPFEWDPAKDRENQRKHSVSFETASLIFEDPWILSNRDRSHEHSEERFHALGEIAPGVVLFVVFTWREKNEQDNIRLICARKASSHE
ncbi:MAG TPA: BrnT family toxin, partial [Terracidiphilus sp.]|nr:BrnT family toxin [Terracidiphilus sp.]